ncbi:MAG: hypothetical protein H0W40_17830 [Methylibium sp.]|uniref:hypothetical protein n=1 Tax=Methylibium sp. TaxID=2067992 RepID=UPI0018566CE3|nr:hypothetical protein [Methylibium sp.]MBA3599214.1 hypothetical protein [Methylibium sp.]
MSTISSRRFFIVVALLVTAVAGALLRSFSAPQSTPYYLGTLLMVMWVPVVGNVISFFAKKFRPSVPVPPTFSSSMPFVAQVVVELKLHSEQAPALPRREQDGKIHCLFITGTEGFSVRVSLLESHIAGEAVGAEAQFLLPAAALPKFPVGSSFHLMQGRLGFGTGQVLSLSTNS